MTRKTIRNPDVAMAVAGDFYRRNSGAIEREVLEQEAMTAVWRAESRTGPGAYDPHLSSLRTFSTVCARRDLLTLAERHARTAISTVPLYAHADGRESTNLMLAETIADDAPDPEQAAIFGEMLRQLPEDARTVVRLILEDAEAFVGASPRRARGLVAEALGWTSGRLRGAFVSIEAALTPSEA